MTDEYRAPQPYDDGPRYDDDRATTSAADQVAGGDEQQRVFAMPAAEQAARAESSAEQNAREGSAVEREARGEGVGEQTPAEPASDSEAADVGSVDATPAPTSQDAATQAAAAAAEQSHFESAPTQQDERLMEAVQRSRHLPLDGEYEVAPVSPQVADNTSAPTTEGEAQPAPGAHPDVTTETAAYPDTTTETAAQTRRIETTPAPAAEPSQPDASSVTAAPEPVDSASVHDDETFAPLGISVTEGLLVKPEKPSNRGFAVLMSVFATVLFAVGYAVAFTFARKLFSPDLEIVDGLMQLVGSMQFYLPVAVFFVVFLFWSLLANRARWWGYIVASQVLAVLVAAACYAAVGLNAVLAGEPFTADVFLQALRDYVHLPGALLAALVAIPVVTWFGGISAMRGRKLTREYEHDLAEYERRVEIEREQVREQRDTSAVE
ncbi:hypothetical protein [Gulosibacter hominis]|uniref:hypothetical protein n=1 Tax=Gulosibacter hominis TaxID=2770504 RepID=UPI001918AF66|nr:hypothetical protein [Gulosibacter hominis]